VKAVLALTKSNISDVLDSASMNRNESWLNIAAATWARRSAILSFNTVLASAFRLINSLLFETF
jgi:hypothetical protein